jgi:hypothetical protein
MDIKNLLCNTTTTSNDNEFTTVVVNNHYQQEQQQQYEKRAFDYYPITTPTSPSSLSSWSDASSISSTNELNSFSPILSPATKTATVKQHQTRTPWTSPEDYLLEKGYLQGLSWAMISNKYLPHRSRGCCWGRFKTLQTKSTSEKKNWSESEDRVLIGAIKKHARLFRQAWRSVAFDLNDRDWKECEIRSARISGLLINQLKRQSLS